jgi:hypothetical protein
MNQRVQDLLKKITYIEADIEIQKQILFSIPSDKQQEMEHVIKVIAAKKNEISTLRSELQSVSPEEHQNIVTLENAVTAFKKIASEKKFKSITIMNLNEECCLHLRNQPKIHCLVKACDENGGWTIISIDGMIQHFSKIDVDESQGESLSC